MCFHNSMSAKAQKLASRYNLKTDIVEIYKEILEEQYHVNAFAHSLYPIVTDSDELQAFNWGLIPSWAKTEEQAKDIENMTINAKADTIFEKPSFRHSILSKRCIVPSTGFFEWRHEGSKKIPYYIRVKDEDIFSMAGIYDVWVNPSTGEIHHSFSIITTDANPLMEYIHNTKKRMPVILSPED
ncbi:SOS response-associated peptidase, partial [Dysgonomonas gadei]|uniref:SOS response-associated peptidase n=1 Tax=Dysgonomonas gadei TaxID=156974 RepID=UPI003AEFE8BD